MTCHVLRMLLSAIEALGIDYVTFRACPGGGRASTLTLTTDDDARRVATALGVELTEMRDDKSEWLWGVCHLDGICLYVGGPMRKRAALEVVP
ncbi:MAG TPA: hypothetical protein VJU58_13755 [Microbacterium sp.]|nr:hypothetical protein [Microbacterium sp.]